MSKGQLHMTASEFKDFIGGVTKPAEGKHVEEKPPKPFWTPFKKKVAAIFGVWFLGFSMGVGSERDRIIEEAPTCWEDEVIVLVMEGVVQSVECAPVDDLTAGYRPDRTRGSDR